MKDIKAILVDVLEDNRLLSIDEITGITNYLIKINNLDDYIKEVVVYSKGNLEEYASLGTFSSKLRRLTINYYKMIDEVENKQIIDKDNIEEVNLLVFILTIAHEIAHARHHKIYENGITDLESKYIYLAYAPEKKYFMMLDELFLGKFQDSLQAHIKYFLFDKKIGAKYQFIYYALLEMSNYRDFGLNERLAEIEAINMLYSLLEEDELLEPYLLPLNKYKMIYLDAQYQFGSPYENQFSKVPIECFPEGTYIPNYEYDYELDENYKEVLGITRKKQNNCDKINRRR